MDISVFKRMKPDELYRRIDDENLLKRAKQRRLELIDKIVTAIDNGTIDDMVNSCTNGIKDCEQRIAFMKIELLSREL